ncbi:MAG: hypothetical protein NUW37_09880 [Planctomycetes bacterium]|nr:hypothetical protein [Planctomycetota bacterium]
MRRYAKPILLLVVSYLISIVVYNFWIEYRYRNDSGFAVRHQWKLNLEQNLKEHVQALEKLNSVGVEVAPDFLNNLNNRLWEFELERIIQRGIITILLYPILYWIYGFIKKVW